MKKILFVIPLMAISLLASCGGNSIEWISKSEFKKKINDYYISKPFEKYVGYSIILESEGKPITDEIKITKIEKSFDADIFAFASDMSQGGTISFSYSILSPDLVDLFNNMGDLKCGVKDKNFILNVCDLEYPEPFHNVFCDLEMTYNTDMALVCSDGKLKSDGKVIYAVKTNFIYKVKMD